CALPISTSRMHRLRESGVTDGADLALAAEYLAATWRFARDAEGGERLVELRDQIASRDWEGVLGDFDSLDEVGWRWWRRNGHFDPSAALRSLRCPTLAVFGGADTAVSIDQNLEPMRSAFKAGSAEDATCIVIDGADHGLSHVDPDDGMRRLHTARGWSSDLWPAVLGWLRERVDLAGE
ncbi:MAG: alpha/beta hydrolase family protein, partial [Phycisphaerales bacterium]